MAPLVASGILLIGVTGDDWNYTLLYVVSAVLLLLYAGNLVFTLVTHRDVFSIGEEGESEANWSRARAFAVLIAATLAAAIAMTAGRVRYHGGGGGMKCHVLSLNASKGRRSGAESGAGYSQPSP